MEIVIKENTTELERLEGIIQQNIGGFYEVGRALMDIRDKRFYINVLGFETFEAYCKARWDFQRTYAYHLIASVKVVDAVSSLDDIQKPSNQLQTRPLEKLSSDQQREAWQKVIDIAPEGKITAALVSKIVRGMAPPSTPKTKDRMGEDTDAVFQLKRWWKKATKKDKQVFKLWIDEGEK